MELCKKKEVSSEPTSYKYLFGYTKILRISSLIQEEFEDKFSFFSPKVYKDTPRGRKRK